MVQFAFQACWLLEQLGFSWRKNTLLIEGELWTWTEDLDRFT